MKLNLNNYIKYATTAVLFFTGASMAHAELAGNVLRATGTVNAVNAAGKARALSAGDTVNVGETLVSGDKSTASFQMKDAAIIAMTSDSAVKVLHYHVHSGASDPDIVDLEFQKGRSRIMTGHADHANITLRMPGAIVHPKGTGVDFTITNGTSSATLRAGSIDVTDSNGHTTTIDIAGMAFAGNATGGGTSTLSTDTGGELNILAMFNTDGTVSVSMADGSTTVINPTTGHTQVVPAGSTYVSGSLDSTNTGDNGTNNLTPGVGDQSSPPGTPGNSTNSSSP